MSIIVKLTEKKGFSIAESKIADYIIANKEEILHLTVRELAKATYTGSSTVMRVIKKVYDGSFSDFKVDLAYEFHNARDSESKIQFQIQNQETAFSIIEKIARVEKESINKTQSMQNYQQIERVTKLINEATIIYIFADDLGIGDLSCYGATKVSTPNIDRLAGQGVQFTNAYATSATSTPSRFGLLTGMYPWRQENTGIAPGNSELIIDTT